VIEKMIRLAILAPTPALRSGLRTLLAADERIQVLAEAAAPADLDDLGALDVLLVAGENYSLESLRAALESAEAPPALLLLSEETSAARSLAGLPLRAWGLLPPEAGEEELLAAVAALHEGLLAATPALVQPLFGPTLALEQTDDLAEELTDRESQVLQLLAQGFPNKQIALQLAISEHTAKFHVSAIYAKLGVTNRTEAVRRGVRLGLIVL
jgi:DNA-binding NarL/FixJ family response regulator